MSIAGPWAPWAGWASDVAVWFIVRPPFVVVSSCILRAGNRQGPAWPRVQGSNRHRTFRRARWTQPEHFDAVRHLRVPPAHRLALHEPLQIDALDLHAHAAAGADQMMVVTWAAQPV